MKGRYFWITLGIIGLSWIANSVYAYSKQLDEPIFLDHYIEARAIDGNFLTFYYVTNIDDNSTISHVHANGVTGHVFDNRNFGSFDFFEPNTYNVLDHNIQTFTHYGLRSMSVEFNQYEIEEAFQDNIFTFNEMDVFFTNGEKMNVVVGEVTFHSPDLYEDVAFPVMSGGGDFISKSAYQADEEIFIEDIELIYHDIVQSNISVHIDVTDTPQHSIDFDEVITGVDIQNIELPIKLKKDENLVVYTKKDKEFAGSAQFLIKFFGTTKSGNDFTYFNDVYHPYPNVSKKMVNELIQVKSKGESQ